MIVSFLKKVYFVFFVMFWISSIAYLNAFTGDEVSLLNGHLQPLGNQGFRKDIQSIHGFPTPKDFYTNYVDKATPLIFKGAALNYPAYKLWVSDEYFLSFKESEYFDVVAEAGKKEQRTRPADSVSFATYVREYKTKDVYMVNSVPDFLKQDVILPQCIACFEITSGNLVQNMMWFSSGGTKSVLHTDYAENILCLLQGRKELFLIDKNYQDQVNVTEKGYSDVDVDSVDLLKYPGLHKLEFHHGSIYPGDCIYIPWLWVHQVRSYERNVAVNLWWRHGLQVNFSSCNLPLNTSMKNLDFIGFGALAEAQIKLMRNKLTAAIKAVGNFSIEDLFHFFAQNLGFISADEWTNDMRQLVQKIFSKLDFPIDDNILTVDDLNKLQYEDWNEIRSLINEMENVLMASSEEPPGVTPGDYEEQTFDSQEENRSIRVHEGVRSQDLQNTRTVDGEKKDNDKLALSDTKETKHTEL